MKAPHLSWLPLLGAPALEFRLRSSKGWQIGDADVPQFGLRPGFRSCNLAKISRLECQAKGARLAFALLAIP